MDPATITAWIGVAVAAGAALGGAIKFFFWAWDQTQLRRQHDGHGPVPAITLHFSIKPSGACWWSMGKNGSEAVMQVVGSVFATNVTNIPIRSLQTEVRYGLFGRRRTVGTSFIANGGPSRTYGLYDIPPGETRDLHFDFWIFPPVVGLTEPFRPKKLIVFDQFGHAHKLRGIEFTTSYRPPEHLTKPASEQTYTLTDPVEKEVAAVLKAEQARFKMAGRDRGALGSIHIRYEGRDIQQLGGDSWTPGSTKNQVIVQDPERAELRSDNLDALHALFSRLDHSGRTSLTRALTLRLDAARGYSDVAYFVIAALLKFGDFPAGLQAASALPVNDDKSWGLSNVLALLNGLLRYKHDMISGEMLDEIERFVHSSTEHSFMISEKVAAVRAFRLSAGRLGP